MDGQRMRETRAVGVASLLVAFGVWWLNSGNDLQGGVFRSHYLGLARHLRGEAAVEVITYPVWGYPALLALAHYATAWTTALQCLLAALTVAALYATAAPTVPSRKGLAVLCIGAVPWFALATARLADIWSASFMVLGVLALSLLFRTGATRFAVLAGLLFGVALNFRSESLGFVVGLPFGVLVLSPQRLRGHATHLVVIPAIAVSLIVPWGLYRVAHDAPFGVTSTNSGMMLVNSLGFQGNRWGIVSNDGLRAAEAREALGPDVLPYSPEGNALFQARFRQALREHPLEYARKVGHNLVTVVAYGFYGIETEPYLTGDDALQFEVLKEQLKHKLGARANPVDIERFRAQGLWRDDFSLADVPVRAWVIASATLLNSLLSAIYLSLVVVATLRLSLLDRERLGPLLLATSLAVFYVFALLGLTQYEPRQANVLYVLGIPLVLDLFAGRWRRRSKDA